MEGSKQQIYSLVAPTDDNESSNQNILKDFIARVKANEVKMCHQRGYTISNDVLNFFNVSNSTTSTTASFEDFFLKKVKEKSTKGKGSIFLKSLCDTYLDTSGGSVNIIYLDNTKNESSSIDNALAAAIGKSDVNVVLNKILKDLLKHVIVVVGGKLTKEAKQSLFSSPSCRMEIWSYDDLAFNRCNHSMVPRHRICIDTSKLNKKEIPEMSYEDIQARWIGASIGDVVEISHKLYGMKGIATGFPTYRLVVGRPLVIHK